MKTIKIKLTLFSVLYTFLVFGQKQESNEYKEHVIVKFSDYDVYYGIKNKDTVKTNIVYNAEGKIISYQNIIKESIIENKKIDTTISNVNLTELVIKANLAIDDDKIKIHPWTFIEDDSLEKFFSEREVYIKIEERKNIKFLYRAFNLGVTTLPIKWYLKSDLGNVETNLNAMVMLGFKFGNQRFVKFPQENKIREYKSLWSANILIGMSKIELNESNLEEGNNYEGNIAAFSTGLSFGKHYRNFSFTLASGFDIPTSNSNDWKFNGVPWLGMGFGYNL